jgi:hypothetical protein
MAVQGLVYVVIQRKFDTVFVPPCLPHVVFNIGQFGCAVATNIHTYSTITQSFNEYAFQKINKSALPYQMRSIYNYVQKRLIQMHDDDELLEIDRLSNFKISNYFIEQHLAILMFINQRDWILFDKLDDAMKKRKLICDRCEMELIGAWLTDNDKFYCFNCEPTDSADDKEEEEDAEAEDVSSISTSSGSDSDDDTEAVEMDKEEKGLDFTGNFLFEQVQVTDQSSTTLLVVVVVVDFDPFSAIAKLKDIQQKLVSPPSTQQQQQQ